MAYVFVIGFLLFVTLKLCLGVLLPFIIGTLIAAVVQKPALKISKMIKFRQGTVALFTVIGIYLILLLVIIFFGSRIYAGLVKIYEKLPYLAENISRLLETSVENIEDFFSRIGFKNSSAIGNVTLQSLGTLSTKAIDLLSQFLSAVLKKAPSFIFGLLVTVISGCFIAKDFCIFKKMLCFALNEKRIEFLRKIKKILYENVFKFFKGYVILSVIAFAVLTVGFLILRVKGAVKIAFITAFIDLLPVFGSGVVLIPWAIISLFNGQTARFIGLIIIYLVVLIIRNFSEPKIVGKQVGLHPLITLLSLFLGVKFFGFMGIFVLPLMVTVIYKYFEEKVTEKQSEHSM